MNLGRPASVPPVAERGLTLATGDRRASLDVGTGTAPEGRRHVGTSRADQQAADNSNTEGERRGGRRIHFSMARTGAVGTGQMPIEFGRQLLGRHPEKHCRFPHRKWPLLKGFGGTFRDGRIGRNGRFGRRVTTALPGKLGGRAMSSRCSARSFDRLAPVVRFDAIVRL